MANIIYPDRGTFQLFIKIITEKNYGMKRYLPHIDDEWYSLMVDCIEYVQHISQYEETKDCYEITALILYKVSKKHELRDGNKRSALMSAFLFCILNNFVIDHPGELKEQATRIASTKGRKNEIMMRKRVAQSLRSIMKQHSEAAAE